ncbi:hypothetical protein [Streptomyces sp. NPDC060035]|uniref:hypothetical protein n=1 Tax=Streptomyces sp. NPDC060035 TaxID=3347044 RepID=UPI0036C11537
MSARSFGEYGDCHDAFEELQAGDEPGAPEEHEQRTGRGADPDARPFAMVRFPSSAAGDGVSTTLRTGDRSAGGRPWRPGGPTPAATPCSGPGPAFGTENGYAMRAVVVGQDHCGFQQFATLPVGTVVTGFTCLTRT